MKRIIIGMLLLTPILGGCSKDSFDPDTGFLQKYGEKTTSDNGQECLRVKFYMNGKTVGDGGYGVSDPSYVDYFPDGSVEWVWREEDYRDNIGAKGTRIDDVGTLLPKAQKSMTQVLSKLKQAIRYMRIPIAVQTLISTRRYVSIR